MDLISIILAAYNAQSTIKRCMESLTAQTYKLYCHTFFSKDGYGIRLDENLHLCEDLLCNLQVLSHAVRIVIDPAPCYHYSFTENNATNSPYSLRMVSLIESWRKIWEHTKKTSRRLRGLLQTGM